MKPGSLIATILLSLVALAHLARLVLGIHVTLETTLVPMWISVLGTIVPAAVAFMLWRESRTTGSPAA